MIKFQWKVNRYISSLITTSQGVSVTAMDDILYSRTVQDCERFCDDVSYKEENLTKKRKKWTKMFRHEHSTAGVSLSRAIVVISGDKSILHPCKHLVWQEKQNPCNFVTILILTKLSVVMTPSLFLTQHSQRSRWAKLGKEKEKKIEKMQNSCFKGFELQGEGLHSINLRRRDVHLREDNRTLLTHS